MPEKHAVTAVINGCMQKMKLNSPVDSHTVERLARQTFVPMGGVCVCFHVPANNGGTDYYRKFREQKPGMAAYVGYTMFETDSVPRPWVDACNRMDEIWVPSRFNVESFTRAGVSPEKLHAVPFEFDAGSYRPSETSPLKINESRGFNFLSIFEWTFRKGWDVLIRAYLEEFSQEEDVRLILRSYQGGGVVGSRSIPVLDQLSRYISKLGYDLDRIPEIEFLDQMVPSAMMPALYRAADAFVLPTRGEGWGIPFTESMLMEVPVIATRWSAHLDFMNDENAYLIDVEDIVPVGKEQVQDNPLYEGHKWAQPSVEHTRVLMRHVFENRQEVKEKGRAARAHILKHYTGNHASARAAARIMNLQARRSRKGTPASAESPGHRMRVLFCHRPGLFGAPADDTKTVLRLKSQMERAGVMVDTTSCSDTNLDDYDLVHIFCRDATFAHNANLRKKPFVVTPDGWSSCKSDLEAMKMMSLLIHQKSGGDGKVFRQVPADLETGSLRDVPGDLDFLYRGADAVLVSGEAMGKNIADHFTDIPLEIIREGYDRPREPEGIDPDRFTREYGFTDFVLCTGALSALNNQLMLLHAMEKVDVPLVFVNEETGQKYYEKLCKGFQRKGKTLFTDKISEEMMLSAYKAAKVHVQPGWCAIPGTASLEAGSLGCNVVTSRRGTAAEYFGNRAWYCDPCDPEGMREAVLNALKGTLDPDLSEFLKQYSWENQAQHILSIYRKILLNSSTPEGKARLDEKSAASEELMAYRKERLEVYQAMRRPSPEGLDPVSDLLRRKPDDPLLWMIRGGSYLMQSNYEEAVSHFKKCVELQPAYNLKGYLSLFLAHMKQENYDQAVHVILDCITLHPLSPKATKTLMYEYLEEASRALAGAYRDMTEKSYSV